MISLIEGTIEHLGDKQVILNTGGIGYRVIVSPKLLNILSKSKPEVNGKIKLFVHSQLNMREGTFDMYGFDKKEDLDLFHMLTSVSGIGPKTASRLILELKSKVDYLDSTDVSGMDLGHEGQAMEALLTLGYSLNQAKEALKEAKGETLELKVADALKFLGKK